jgi:hypothetical protein
MTSNWLIFSVASAALFARTQVLDDEIADEEYEEDN